MCIKPNTYLSPSALFRKVYLTSFTTILSLLFIAPTSAVQTNQSSENLYENGLTEKEKGNYEKALEIWSQAKTTLQESDFRIAQAYIELATDKKLKENYQEATELYYWGLSGTISENEKEYLLAELQFLQPLFRNRDFRNFRNKIRDADAGALAEIKKYWINRDPTPLNSYNERLIEHWERISYARENYSELNSEELDGRGKVYLKYGNPFYTRSGRLNYKSSLVHRLLLEGIRTPSFGSAEQINITSTQRYNLEVQIRQLHTYPYYEIWMYRGLSSDEEEENTIFIFGTEGNTNSGFDKINSLEDFIPNEAYRRITQNNYTLSSSNNSDSEGSEAGESDTEFDDVIQTQTSGGQVDITPALILQLMYYDQFAAFDEYFGRAYNEMMDRFIDMSNTPNTNMTGLAREFGTVYGSKLIQIQSAAPLEKSEQKDEILPLPSENYTYRFLDENNNSYLRTYSAINLEKAVYYDLLKDTNSLQTDMNNRYALVSGYLLKDENNNDVDKHIKTETINSPDRALNFMEIPYQSESQRVTLSHELHKSSEINDSTISSNTAYSESLKGLSNYTIDLPEPLNSDELALSDLIIGYSYSDDYSYSGDSLNFTIAHDKNIPQDADINLYYELYNLQPNPDGISDFTFHYSIHEESGGRFLGIFKRQPDEEISITINNSVADDRYKNVLTIKTSTLEPGEYELDVEIEDLNSGADFSRTVSFNIPEN